MFIELKKIGKIEIDADAEMFLTNFLLEQDKNSIALIANDVIKAGIYFLSVQEKLNNMALKNADKNKFFNC